MTDYDGHFVMAELALSNRSTCRGCKQIIYKNQLRLGCCYDDDNMRTYPWNHLECFYLTKKFLDLNIEPKDIKGYSELPEAEKIRVADRILKLKSGEIDKKKKQKKKAVKQEDIQPEDAKKYKPGGYTAQQRKQFENYKRQYAKFSNKQLQAMLQYNEQAKTGTKQQLLQRVADGWLLGSIPKCKECGEGRLKFNRFDGTYRCGGHHAEEYFRKCGRKFRRDEIQRDQFA